MKVEPLVSIITPIFNSEKYLPLTINSVKKQTITNWELILIDDNSSDNSYKIAEEFAREDNRIKLIRNKQNLGPAITRNIGIKEAKGRYIAFLDSDDEWLPKKLEKQIKFLNSQDLAFTYSAYYIVEEGNESFVKIFFPDEEVTYEKALKGNPIGCSTAIYDTKILGKVYMPNILKRQDYGLWLEILKRVKKTKGILEPLAKYRRRKNSVSSNKIKAALYQWKIYRDIEKLPLHKSIYYFLHYSLNGLKKHKL